MKWLLALLILVFLVCLTAVSALKQCVQCNDEVSGDCGGKTEATDCPFQDYNYCATSKTVRFSSDSKSIFAATTRSCAIVENGEIPYQGCRFTSNNRQIYQYFITYVCLDFCAEDGCNNKVTPKIELEAMRCVVCSENETTENCEGKTETTLCSIESTYCKTMVAYYPRDGKGNEKSTYRIVSITRECTTERVDDGQSCTTAQDESGIVTCEETCDTSGCNVGPQSVPSSTS